MPAKYPVPKKQSAQIAMLQAAKGKKKGKKPRSSHMELAERRQMVIRLRLQGMTLREIAKELNTGYMSVKRDLDLVREEVGKKVGQFDRDYALGKSISVYEQIESEAWQQFYSVPNGTPARAQFLNLVRTARNDQVKLLTEVGLINKAPTQVQHQFEANQVLKGWTDDAKKIVALAIIRSQMDGGEVPKALLDSGKQGRVINIPEELVDTVKAATQEAPGGDNGHGQLPDTMLELALPGEPPGGLTR